jgi:recombination protein RecR
MALYPESVQNLIDNLSKLPGIGPKSAQRIALFLVSPISNLAYQLADSAKNAKENIRFCKQCFNMTDSDLCEICSNPQRNSRLICIVEEPKDVIAMEKTREYNGLYHVLGGVISPISNIGPDDVKLKELLDRLDNNEIEEIILATNPNIEGEATSMYIADLLKPRGLKVTRIASGLPVGGDLEYADEITLGRALTGRRDAI